MKKLILCLIALGMCIFSGYAFAGGIDANTVLLLHGNGDDGSTNFIDDSPSNHPVTANGDAQVDTAYKKFGTGSILFDGIDDYLNVPDSADWAFGSGDFTIDFWVRFNNIVNSQYSIGQWINSGPISASSWLLVYEPGAAPPRLRFSVHSSSIDYTDFMFTWTDVSIDTWYHIAVVRNGNNLTIYVNGTSLGTQDISAWTLNDASQSLKIGNVENHLGQHNDGLIGRIDELRVSKGIARWTSDFIPPTEEYGYIPNDPPTADAGLDVIANAGEQITLDGSYSNDPDGNIVSWIWRSLSDPQAPIVAEGEIAAMTAHGYVEELIELTVTDNNGTTATDTMKITNTIVEDAQEIPQLQNEITQLQNQLETQQEVIDKLKQFPALENWINKNK